MVLENVRQTQRLKQTQNDARKAHNPKLQLNLLQTQQRQNINLQRFNQLFKRGALVGTVHGTGEFRQLNVGMLRAKADGIREVTRIGTCLLYTSPSPRD